MDRFIEWFGKILFWFWVVVMVVTSLFLFSGCSVPLVITTEQKGEALYKKNELILINVMAAEPFWQGKRLSMAFLSTTFVGFTYETFDDYIAYLKKTHMLGGRDDIIDEWAERIKERYERITNGETEK